MRNSVLIFLFACAFLSSCVADKSDKRSKQPLPEEEKRLPLVVESNAESIQANLIEQNCISCHKGADAKNRHVDLSDITHVIESSEHNHDDHARRDLVKPGCPTTSFFLSIMKEGKMPPKPAEKVSEESLKAVEDWIISLKPDATCDDFDDDEPVDPADDDEPGGR